ncbi:homeobox domain-containing protein, partial [Blyttiomyces helicus]
MQSPIAIIANLPCPQSHLQLIVLQESFEQNSMPTNDERKTLAEQIGMDPRTIQIWFQNRRAARKK